jgi:hypothetical protein
MGDGREEAKSSESSGFAPSAIAQAQIIVLITWCVVFFGGVRTHCHIIGYRRFIGHGLGLGRV